MRIAILVPARDEAEALPGLFEALRPALAGMAPPADVVVVDNGSSDDTAGVARSLGARVVREPRPGYGRACLSGIDAIAADGPPDVLVFLDADDHLAPAGIRSLLDPIAGDAADLVIGERVAREGDGGVRWHARLGNRLVLAAMRLRYGSRVRDMGPFRAIRWTTLVRLDLDDRNYGWYVQMQVRALRAGARVLGTPVAFERRTAGASKVSGSAIASVRAGWVMLRTLAVEMLRPSDARAGGTETRDQSRADTSS